MDVFSNCGKVKMPARIVRKSYFYELEKSGKFGVAEPKYAAHRDRGL